MATPYGKQSDDKNQGPINGAAHDLNNVMMTIAGSAELMIEAAGQNPSLRLMAERILRASRDGMALVNNLKALAASPAADEPSPGGINQKRPA